MSTNEINIEAVNARAKEEQTPMNQKHVPSLELCQELDRLCNCKMVAIVVQ